MLEGPHRGSLYLHGHPIEPLSRASKTDGGGRSVKVLPAPSSRIYFRNKDKTPGLRVVLDDGVDVWFSQSAKLKNFITLDGLTRVVFDKLEYTVDDSAVEGRLKGLSCKVRDGKITSGEAIILLEPGTSLTAGDISFSYSRAAKQGVVESRYGMIVANAGKGSQINLASQGEDRTYFTLDDNSKRLFCKSCG